MHEGLITKGQVRNNPNDVLINTRYNCVLVHPTCHQKIQGGGGMTNFEKCARHLVHHEGIEAVRDWLATMSEEDSLGRIGLDALRRFDTINWNEPHEKDI